MGKVTDGIPFLKITVAYIIGITTANLLPGMPLPAIAAIILALLISAIFINRIKTLVGNRIVSAILILILFFGGYARQSASVQVPVLHEGEYYYAFLTEFPVAKTRSQKVELKLTAIVRGDSIINAAEKMIVYFESDSLSEKLAAGDRILFTANPEEIANQGNPYEFDYKKYLARKKIFRQVYLQSGKWHKTNIPAPFTIKIVAEKIRSKLLAIYGKNHIEGEQLAILSALTLGYKESLTREIKGVFAGAGATHVLAVSGLHVGILFLLFSFLLNPLKQVGAGKYLYTGSMLAIIWFYALITGLSPSVLRSAAMFSLIIIAGSFRKPTNIYNTLAASAFILLAANPEMLFNIGFQLSYSAVLGIVFFQPRIYNLFRFKYWLPDKIWSLFAVSVAAQLTTFPLALYYFNQFPVYFWLSNFIVIPAAFLFIFAAIAIFILSPFPAISALLAKVVSAILWLVFESLKTICRLPGFLAENINIGGCQLFLLLLAIILAMYLTAQQNPRYLSAISCLLILLFSINIYNKAKSSSRKEIIIYNFPGKTAIHLIRGRESYILSGDTLKPDEFGISAIKSVCTARYLPSPKLLYLNNSYEDDNLYIKNNVISFLGENFIIEPHKGDIPDIDFRFYISEFPDTSLIQNTKVISTASRIKKGLPPDLVFLLKKEGAYQYIF